MLKALFIIPEYPPGYGGGIASYYGELLPRLSRQGIEVKVIVGSAVSSPSLSESIHGVQVESLDRSRIEQMRSKFPEFSLAPDFCRHLAAAWTAWEQAKGGRDYDVVECTDWGHLSIPWIVSPEGPPVLVRMHASLGQIARHGPQTGYLLSESISGFTEDLLFSFAEKCVTYSLENQLHWSERLRRRVDYASPIALTDKSFSGCGERSQRGLVVGRVQGWKGPETLCKALARLGKEAPTIDWIGRNLPFTGRGITWCDYLQSSFPEIWGKRIRHQGPIAPDQIRKRQASAGFVIVPSDWDVFNLGATEAMSTGAIVICSDGAGASDVIEDGINGFVFAAGDDESLSRCILKATGLPGQDRERISAAARRTILERLDPDRIALQHMQQLKEAAGAMRHRVPEDYGRLFSPSRSTVLGEAGLDRIPVREVLHFLVKRMISKFSIRR